MDLYLRCDFFLTSAAIYSALKVKAKKGKHHAQDHLHPLPSLYVQLLLGGEEKEKPAP